MEGISDQPFRSICRSYGSAASVTEFINCNDILKGTNYYERKIAFIEEERPIGFQIYGNSAEQILSAALKLELNQPDFIDINLGCSVRRVANHGSGARLLDKPEGVGQIILMLVKHLHIPVTAKIRLGKDKHHLNYLEIAKILIDSGAAAIAVHARTRQDNWQDKSNWNAIAEIKNLSSIPVIGNGDIKLTEDIDQMISQTGCDAVMIGRAALGNPWIFSRIRKDELSQPEIIQMIQAHWSKMIDFYGFEVGAQNFRKHLKAYLSAPQFQNLDLKTIIQAGDPLTAIDKQIKNR